MIRHPYDYEAPPLSTEGERAQHQHDERRDLAPAALHFVPPLAAYDIHAKLTDAIQYWEGHATRGSRSANTFSLGLREAYFIVFGETAP